MQRLLLMVLVFVSVAPALADQPVRFSRITLEQGLSQNSVNCILQDQRGFLWVGTNDGLNRYDGYGFTVFRNNPNRPGSLTGNLVETLLEDKQGTLWVGTDNGLNRFDPQTETFTTYITEPNNPYSLPSSDVHSLCEMPDGTLLVLTRAGMCLFSPQTGRFLSHHDDPEHPVNRFQRVLASFLLARDGTLWVGAEQMGLIRYEPHAHRSKTYLPAAMYGASVPNQATFVPYQDETGTIWIGQRNGFSRYDPTTDSFAFYKLEAPTPENEARNAVVDIKRGPDGRLWLALESNGLCIFDPASQTLTFHRNDPTVPSSLSRDNLHSLYCDRAGIMWVGTDGGGLCAADPNAQRFQTLTGDRNNPNSLSGNYIRALCEDSAGRIWIGTFQAGITCFDPKSGQYQRFRNDPHNPNSLPHDNIWALCVDWDDTLWIGCDRGLCHFDPKTKRFTSYWDVLPHLVATAVLVDQSKTLWVGLFRGGLFKYDRKQDRFIAYCHDPAKPRSLCQDEVRTIFQDHAGGLWVGTQGGLAKFDPSTESFTNYQHDPRDPRSLSHGSVVSLCEDRNGTLWVGTYGGGLNRFNPATGTFTALREANGLPNDVIYGVQEDSLGNLWMSTNKGLARYTPSTGNIHAYDVTDGLQSNEFNQTAALKTREGVMYFGGIAGLNAFIPEQISSNTYMPPVVLTGFQVFNQPFPLPKSITAAETITVNYQDNVMTFEFAALSFSNPQKNQYAVLLEGFDQTWRLIGTQRSATYTNLDGGTYRFRVKGCNNDGLWNQTGAMVTLVVKPPIWKTPWAYTLYAVTFLGLAYGGMQLRTRTLRFRTHLLETQVRERTAELQASETETRRKALELAVLVEQLKHSEARAKEASHAKSMFLSSMSHELRTPLNAIIGFAQVMERTAHRSLEDREHLAIITRSSEHLLGLINDVLSIAKIEAGQVTLKTETFDLRRLLKGVEDMFRIRTTDKALSFVVDFAPNLPTAVIGDESKLRQVLINLLGNAVKFTTSGGITLRASWHIGSGSFAVEDTGPGIPPGETETIFEAFAQTATGQKAKEGTGLGLTISRNFVRLMGGEIGVESTVGEGTTFRFTIRLPLAAQPLAVPDKRVVTGLISPATPVRILIADDIYENRLLLVKLLQGVGFEIAEAENGRETLEICRTWKPDLIFLDLRMPELDGFATTQAIRLQGSGFRVQGSGNLPAMQLEAETQNPKRTTQTAENPLNPEPRTLNPVIVALTASAFDHDRERVMSLGCDDFLTKPFQESQIFETIRKHLGVEYRYATSAPLVRDLDTRVILTPIRLASIKADTLAELYSALSSGDDQEALRAIAQVAEYDPALGQKLQRMVKNFQLDDLMDLIERIPK
ncbi:MAG: response regulator [Blastocatellia bacterium]|nr:response regulator [Blastocatellia bacterium]